MIPFIDLKTQQLRIREKLEARMMAVLDHGQYVMGPEITELENELASFTGAKHAIACSSGTDALLIGLMAIGVGPGDDVLVPNFSFFATVEIPYLLGANPIFVDINPKTYNICPKDFKKKITPNSKAVIPVSLYGQCAELEVINDIAKSQNIIVMEDAAQSFGGERKGIKSCNLSEIATTSFFPAKPLGAYGDGGAIFTSDDNLAKRFREILNHGQEGRYNHVEIGINGRMDTIQAAILIEKLAIFDEERALRNQVADLYNEFLPASIERPFVEEDNYSIWAQYVIRVSDRPKVMEKLKELGVPTSVHYPDELSAQPAFKGKFQEVNTPHSALAAKEVLALPMHPYLAREQVQAIGKALNEI